MDGSFGTRNVASFAKVVRYVLGNDINLLRRMLSAVSLFLHPEEAVLQRPDTVRLKMARLLL
jgi:hypothetical protein